MRTFILKTFYRSKVVRAIVYNKDKRISVYYTIPEGSKIKLEGNIYELNENDFYLQKGIPTYLYNRERVDPINPFDVEKSVLKPDFYDASISSKVAKEIFLATKGDGISNQLLLIAIFVIGVLMVAGLYFIYDAITTLQEGVL